jgi:ferredoxin
MDKPTIRAVPMEQCYGCGCCVAVCTKSAVEMNIDAEGFLRPQLNADACNCCGLCVEVCPAMSQEPLYNLQDNTPFALWAKDSKLRLMASSGGAALSIALAFSGEGHSILGAVFDGGFRFVKHIVANNPVNVIKTTGSKYVQSNSAAAFKNALAEPNKKYVAFGTPCQINGLRNLIRHKKIEDNYFLVDLFCHGVPSYLLWWAFVDDLAKNLGALQHLELRNKSRGWHRYEVFAVGTKGMYAKIFTKTSFGRFFLSNYCLRQTCYSCQYGRKSDADMRLGDFWGREFSDDILGVSLAVPLNDKGFVLIEKTPGLAFRSVPKSWMMDSQARLKSDLLPVPPENSVISEKLRHGKALNDVYKEHLSRKHTKAAFKRFPYKVAGAVLPSGVKKWIRSFKRSRDDRG